MYPCIIFMACNKGFIRILKRHHLGFCTRRKFYANFRRCCKFNQAPVESLQSHCIHTQFHWSSGPPICFSSWGTRVQSPGEYLCETRILGILLLALSRYIGDPDVIDHCGLVWDRLCLEPSLPPCTDNLIIPLNLTQLSCPGFVLAADPPCGFTTDIVGCWGEPCGEPAISLHSYTVPLVQWSTCLLLIMRDMGSIPRGYLCETGILLLALSRYTPFNFFPNIISTN